MTGAAEPIHSNPLDRWACERMDIAENTLTRDSMAEYQLRELRATVHWARMQSPFYRTQLTQLPADFPRSFAEFAAAPMTAPENLVELGPRFLCVPQREISRVVSLETSGTSGQRKRIFLTAEDQNLALHFFSRGVASMAAAGDRMLIALPGEREGSVGFQLAQGIARAGVTAIPHGWIIDSPATLQRMLEEKASLLIGLPVQVLALSAERSEVARQVFRRLHTIVLCSEHVPQSLVERVRRSTGCEIFEHYGSTEMGLGGGVDCSAHGGYHLREADLFFEIVSPENGEPLPEGETGEVVFTTLRRRGMPLIRYRTGDLSRIIPGPCCCGSPLRRLERICNRAGGAVKLGSWGSFTLAELDESLFALPDLLDFTVTLREGSPRELQVRVYAPHAGEAVVAQAEEALRAHPAMGGACAAGELQLRISAQAEAFPITGAKRIIGRLPIQ